MGWVVCGMFLCEKIDGCEIRFMERLFEYWKLLIVTVSSGKCNCVVEISGVNWISELSDYIITLHSTSF